MKKKKGILRVQEQFVQTTCQTKQRFQPENLIGLAFHNKLIEFDSRFVLGCWFPLYALCAAKNVCIIALSPQQDPQP